MYIPTQEERYSKVARITLFLCVIVPPGVVAWLGQVGDVLACACGFLFPIALPISWFFECSLLVALCLSALLQAVFFFLMVRSRTLTAKGKVTLAITWGMLFALILRLMIAYEVWVNAVAPAAAP